MKDGFPTARTKASQSPSEIKSPRLQATAALHFHVCQWPDFYATMSFCDRDLYQWIEKIPAQSRPGHLQGEMQRISQTVSQQQYQQWLSCESGRYASTPESGMRITVSSRLTGLLHTTVKPSDSALSTRLSVAFSPDSVPPPATCPALPYHYLHKVDKLGINYYPQNTQIQYTSNTPATFGNGTGPWEGSKVMIVWTLNNWPLFSIQNFFRMEARITSAKVFDHWASFKTIDNPEPPASLMARSEPFSLGALQIQTSVPYDWSAPEGQHGQGWHLFVEYTHVESGQTWLVERWHETPIGWNALGLGGYGADHTLWDFIPNLPDGYGDIEGTWVHRICVYEFKRLPTPVSVFYNGAIVETGFSSITPLMTTPYVPGVSAGIARCDEIIPLRTVGASKASFRILNVEPVAGFGIRLTIRVVNELHFAACIVTPSLTGIGDRTSWQDNAMHFYMPAIWVVRNLPAHTESEPISILVPMNIVEPGDWPLRDLNWRQFGAQEAYPAVLNQMVDGVYGSQQDSYGQQVGPYPSLGNWPPPGYKISDTPEQYAYLLAGYLENGDKVWHSLWDSTTDTNRLLMTVPVRKSPGAEVPYVHDPRYGDDPFPTYFDQVPFQGIFEWTAEYRVSSGPDVWEPRSGKRSLGIDLPTAIARYGRYMTLSVAEGRPMWSPYYQRWIPVFETWPGGSTDELETHLIDTYLRPQYPPEWGWRNFQATALKKPYLTANVMWWFASSSVSDRPGYIHALTLIKESSSAETVDVMLMGYW